MGYETLERLFEVEVDGTEVRVCWRELDEDADPSERVFLQLDSERALERDPAEKELYWLLRYYGDLLAEELASYLADTLDL